ncbi:MAG: LTA synthase family protein [Pigmentiphaga sp.]|nr:LTA synthase family protein [Pigmentiphaga sp.]
MLKLTLRFWIAGLLLFAISRLGLMAWQSVRVDSAAGWWPILVGGLRFDIVVLCMLSVPVAVLAPWLGHWRLANRVTSIWYAAAWLLLAFLEVITPAFIQEYDSRPNRLLVEYLNHPREVAGMLWYGFGATLLAVTLAMAGAAALAWWWFRDVKPEPRRHWLWRTVLSVALLAVMVLGIRGTLQHRPINPATVAFCSDAMLNTLPLNSFYQVTHAIYRMKDERSASSLYGAMPFDEIIDIVRTGAGMGSGPGPRLPPTWHRQLPHAPPVATRPRNVVVIVEESLGAQFVGHLGGRALTPQLDALAAQAWTFTSAYATGTRSARGLEAIVAGFPPTPAESVLKLSKAQGGFFTLPALLREHGYHSRFVYGGEAHFDNMSGFFLANGFDQVIDRPEFVDTRFVGSWGASDEDMFQQVDRLLRSDPPGRPTFTLAFSVSHHTPWDYPAGRIETVGEAASQDNAIRYADWALGDFFRRARAAPYWQDTLFLVIADHDSRAGGASLVPVHNFHIPALLLGAGIEPRRDARLVSQIDFAPTLLGLLGLDSEHPMIGQDLNQATAGGRAMLQYGDNFGWLTTRLGDGHAAGGAAQSEQPGPPAAATAPGVAGGAAAIVALSTPRHLLVLEPGGKASQWRHQADGTLSPEPIDPALARRALAHALWPEHAYRDRQYRLAPPLAAATGAVP